MAIDHSCDDSAFIQLRSLSYFEAHFVQNFIDLAVKLPGAFPASAPYFLWLPSLAGGQQFWVPIHSHVIRLALKPTMSRPLELDHVQTSLHVMQEIQDVVPPD